MKYLTTLVFILLAGCANIETHTMSVIEQAAEAAPDGVPGEYSLSIKATGIQNDYVYLNTESDYRDQRSLTVTLHPSIITELTAKYQQPPETFFMGKRIIVKGEAKRAKIRFYSRGQATDKYYYQTHIKVTNTEQIEIVDSNS